MNEQISNSKFYFIGNNLSLDFVNTEVVSNNQPADLIADGESFLEWAAAAHLLENTQSLEKLRRQWRSAAIGKDLAEVFRFRKILRELFVNLAAGKTLKSSEIAQINEYLKKQNGYAALEKNADGFVKRFHAEYRKPSELLAPVAESAADLLCYGNTDYLRKCESSTCVLYFYDTTKNHRRRWCSMAGCGNRAKAAKFYRKRKIQS